MVHIFKHSKTLCMWLLLTIFKACKHTRTHTYENPHTRIGNAGGNLYLLDKIPYGVLSSHLSPYTKEYSTQKEAIL